MHHVERHQLLDQEEMAAMTDRIEALHREQIPATSMPRVALTIEGAATCIGLIPQFGRFFLKKTDSIDP